MMTMTRQDRVLRALDEGLPANYTWTEQCDPAWRAAFPCGFQPPFEYSTTITLCTEQIVRAGAPLDTDAFEEFLDALIDWVFKSAVPFQYDETVEHVMQVVADLLPENMPILQTAATLNRMTLVEFLGADRRDSV